VFHHGLLTGGMVVLDGVKLHRKRSRQLVESPLGSMMLCAVLGLMSIKATIDLKL
jgi:hypothetical protein